MSANVKKFFKMIWRNLLAILFFVLMVGSVTWGLVSVSSGNEEESHRIAEDSLRRAIVSCYALEGRYPSSYAYIKENYGVSIDEEKYIVHYDVVASNLMPNFGLIER